MTDINSITFEQCKTDKAGTIYAEWEEDGYKLLIMRGPASLCAYIGVPKGHPLYGKDYDEVDIDCHGGLTFSGEGSQDTSVYRTPGYWYFGWDYAHFGDVNFYDDPYMVGWHKWTPKEVYLEMKPALGSLTKRYKNDR
jgi:hypothetical protein